MQQIHNHDAVLNLWAEGRSTSEICSRLRIGYYSIVGIVARARAKGDERATARANGRPVQRDSGVVFWRAAARKRGITVAQLKLKVMETIERDNLLSAILDD